MKEKKKAEQEILQEKKKDLEKLCERLTELADNMTTEEKQLMAAASRSSQKAHGKETATASFEDELDQHQEKIKEKEEEIEV